MVVNQTPRLMRGRKGLGKSRTSILRSWDFAVGARDPHPDPRLAPGVRGELGRASHFTFPRSLPSRKGGSEAPGVPIESGLGRAGSSAGRARARERGQASSLVSDGRWVKVTKVDDLWKVNDEWWRGAGEEIARLYYMIRLENSQQLTVYLDLITNNWYRQAG